MFEISVTFLLAMLLGMMHALHKDYMKLGDELIRLTRALENFVNVITDASGPRSGEEWKNE